MRGRLPRTLLPLAVLVLTACRPSAQRVAVDLLPAGGSGRVEAALTLPRGGMLKLGLELAAPDDGAPDAAASSRLEVWLHGRRARGHLLATYPLPAPGSALDESLDLAQLAGHRALVQAVPRGVDVGRLRWQRATIVGESAADFPAGGGSVAAADPDIIVYVVDTLRADALSSYGGTLPTPHFDRLASEGVRFVDATSPASWTRPATASLLTGLYPSSHGAEDRAHRLPEAAFSLAERLLLRGYATAAVIANANIDAVWGFDQGFETFIHPDVPRDSQGRARRHLHAVEAHEVAARHWWRLQEDERPAFLYVHVVDPHGPYDPPEWLLDEERPRLRGNTNHIQNALNKKKRQPTPELMADLRRLYDAEVAYSDRAFGDFLAALGEGTSENTVIVVTSDHGEAFQEHGFSSHGMSLFDEEIRVPLVLWGPGRFPAGTVVERPVSLIDVVPTLLADIPLEELHGIDLATTWEGGGERALLAEIDYEGRRWQALRDGDLKLLRQVDSDRQMLFDLGADPEERRDLAAIDTATAERLSDILQRIYSDARTRRLVSGEAEEVTPNAEVIENLRALGYVQ